LRLIGEQDLRGLDEAADLILSSKNIHQTLIDIINDKTIYDFVKTPENLGMLIYDAVVDRLGCPSDDIQLFSFSGVTGRSQPQNTCPMIDEGIRNIDTWELEREVDSYEDKARELNKEVAKLEGDLSNPDLFEEDDESEESRRKEIEDELYDLSNEIENVMSELDEKREELKETESEIKAEAENLRESCSITRDEIAQFRKNLYSYFKGLIYEFEDNGTKHLVFHPELQSTENRPSGWEEFDRFNRKLLEQQDFSKAIRNYDAIIEWGVALIDLEDSAIKELFDDALEVDDLIRNIVENAIEDARESGAQDLAS
jgi:hypothetical protein